MNQDMSQVNSSPVKKKGTGKNVVIVLLVLLVCALGGYLVYEKVFMEKEEKVETSKIGQDASSKKGMHEKEVVCDESLEVTSELVQKLYSTLIRHPNHAPGYYFKNVKVEAKDIPRESAVESILYTLQQEGIIQKGANGSFSEAQLDSVVDKIFGKNYSFSHGSLNSCPVTTYDASTKTYSFTNAGCGSGTSGPGDEIKIVKALKNDKGIEIYLRIVFLGNDGNYYKDANKTQIADVFTSGDEDFGKVMVQMDSNYAKGALYKITFSLEDGNYVFTSSEAVSG